MEADNGQSEDYAGEKSDADVDDSILDAEEDEVVQGEGEGLKRKSEEGWDAKEDGSKRAKTDNTVLLDVFMATSKDHVSPGEIKKFLNSKNVKVMEVTQPEWIKCGTVRVCDEEDMNKVFSLGNQKVGRHKLRFESAQEEDVAGSDCVVVAWQLAPQTTGDDLQAIFSEVKEVRVPQAANGNNKGFAYLEFYSIEDALSAIDRNQGVKLRGKELDLKMYQRPTALPALSSLTSRDTTIKDENKRVLFVGNMRFETTEEMLQEYFTGCKMVRILRHKVDGRSKGMGFVHFDTASAALQALIEKKDTELDGRRILVQFADGERRTAEDYRREKPKDGNSQDKPGRGRFTSGFSQRGFSDRGFGRGSFRGGFSERGSFRGGFSDRGSFQGAFPERGSFRGGFAERGSFRGNTLERGFGGSGRGFLQGSGRGMGPGVNEDFGPRNQGMLDTGFSRERFRGNRGGPGRGLLRLPGPAKAEPNSFDNFGPGPNRFSEPGPGPNMFDGPGPGSGSNFSAKAAFRKNLEEELEQTKRLEDALWRRMMLESQLKKMDSSNMGMMREDFSQGGGFGMDGRMNPGMM